MKNYKRIVAVTLAATMVLGSAMTVFAEEANPETPAAGVATGTGTYEGGEMEYPTLSVTLPAIPAGTYDYIADPNGLIAATDAAKYADSDFATTAQGIFFLTEKKGESGTPAKNTYSEKSTALSLTNENAQDLDVTVKLEQKTAGDAGIQYTADSTFAAAEEGATNTEKQLYLALVQKDAVPAAGEGGDPSDGTPVPLLSTGAATITAAVAGTPDNYEAGYSEDDGYGYTLKAESDLTDWNDCSFYMTGALNTAATWGNDLTFPTIQVTWSYKEHTDGPTASGNLSAANGSTVTISGVAEDATLSSVVIVPTSGDSITMKSTKYSYDATTGTYKNLADLSTYAGGKFVLTFSDESTVEISIVAAE